MKFYAVSFFLICVACTKEKPSADASNSVPPVGLAGGANAELNKIYEGSVQEILTKDQYSYVRLDNNWFALLSSDLKVGSKVKIQEEAVFSDFHSKVLDKTFKKLSFGLLLEPKPANGQKPIQYH